MPLSCCTPPSRSRSPSSPARRPLAADEDAVSEVVGYLLVFAIMAALLVLSMVAFGAVQEKAGTRVTELRAASVAERVAAAAVDAALFAEAQGVGAEYLQPLDLPEKLEGHDYTVSLDEGPPEQVRIRIEDLDLDVTAALFSATAAASVDLCASSAPGGDLQVRFAEDPDDPAATCLFLEERP